MIGVRCLSLLMLLVPMELFAQKQNFYCPENHSYISLGMSPDQVIAACGQPLSQQDSNQPILQKIPVQQLIYNNKGTATAFYGVWNIPTGSGGTPLEINIVNRKVKSIRINNDDSNAVSICGGNGIEIGDPVAKVYYACGSPSVTNNTYIHEVIPTSEKPKIWIYQPGEYQNPVSLTFVNGRLQSID